MDFLHLFIYTRVNLNYLLKDQEDWLARIRDFLYVTLEGLLFHIKEKKKFCCNLFGVNPQIHWTMFITSYKLLFLKVF